MLPRSTKNGPSYSTWLSTAVVILAASIFVLVPLFVNPYNVVDSSNDAFIPPKFTLLLSLTELLVGVIVVASVLGLRLIRVPMLVPAVAFLTFSTFSTVLSANMYLSLFGSEVRRDGLLSLAAGVLLFYAAARFLNSWIKVRFFLATGVAAAVLIAAYGIAQRFGVDPLSALAIDWPKWSNGTRVFSTMGAPIFLAAYLTLMIGPAMALYFLARSRGERVLWLFCLAVISACWFYTYTRGAILGVGITLPIVFWVAHRRIGTARPLFVPLATWMAAVLTAAVLPVAVAGSGSPPLSGDSNDTVGSARLLSLHDNRLLIWRDTIPVVLERPLFGQGPDNVEAPFARYEGEDLKAIDSWPIDKAHNEFLQVAATTGLLGLAAYIWIFAAYFRNAYKHGEWALIALAGWLLAYILELQTSFTSFTAGIPFWGILGASAALMRLSERYPNGKKQSEGEQTRVSTSLFSPVGHATWMCCSRSGEGLNKEIGVSVSTLVRWSGLLAVVGNVLFIIIDLLDLVVSLFLFDSTQGFDPTQVPNGATFVALSIQATVATLGGALLALGLMGLYIRQSEATGIIGLAGFLTAFFGLVLAPAGISGAALLANLGWALFGGASLRAKVYPRIPVILLLIGAVVSCLVVAFPAGLISIQGYVGAGADILLNVAIAWLGFSLWSCSYGAINSGSR